MFAMSMVGLIKRGLSPHLLEWMKTRCDLRRDRRILQSNFRGLAENAAALSAACLRGIHDWEEWLRLRPICRQRLSWMLGLDPLPARTPLNASVTGTLERERYTIENVVFESSPGLLVTGNLYLPKGARAPAPCILYLCGHQIHPLGAKTQYQDRFLWYPNHGFACFVVDSLLCGEVPGLHRGTHTLGQWDWLSLGYTPAGVEIWNAMRALDYLETRAEVDSERIGATGTSGGGVMTWFLTALDERVKVAAPSASAYTIGSQVRRRLIPRQCDCTFYPNVFQMDFPEVGALVAPRPVLILAGRRDRIFPPAGYREFFRKLTRIYGLCPAWAAGRPSVELAETNHGHAETPETLRRTREWMVRWLAPNNDEARNSLSASISEKEAPETLACLDRIPAQAANFAIHKTFIPAHVPAIPKAEEEWNERRTILMDQLRTKVFGWFPNAGGIPFQSRKSHGRGGHAQRFARFSEWEFASEAADHVRIQFHEPKNESAVSPLLVVVQRRVDSLVFPDDELLPLLSDHRVMIVVPRFVGWNPTPAGRAEAERAAALCGRTLDALQVWDAMRAVRWALDERGFRPAAIRIFGRGDAGLVGLYAALFEPRIDQVVLQSPPASHRDGPALLGVLRITDVPEVAGLLAPRWLTFVGEPPAAFSMTRAAYRLAGAESRCQIAENLVAAMRRAGPGAIPPPGGSSRHSEE